MLTLRQTVLPVLLSLALVSCGTSLPSTCIAGDIAGMIVIQAAVVKGTDAPVASLRITNITRDGVGIPASQVDGIPAGGQVSGVRVEGDPLVCDVRCSFTSPGRSTFDVGAIGMVTQHLEVNVPPRNGGGCGGITTGTPVTLNLRFLESQVRGGPLSWTFRCGGRLRAASC